MKSTIKITFFLLFLLQSIKIKAQEYQCFVNDNNPSMEISIYSDNSGVAKKIIYKGQKSWINLVFVKTIDDLNSGGAYPVFADLYNEVYNGKVTGRYTITKSGIWYYVKYKRKKDGKIFNFTIREDTLNEPQSRQCF
jgi:hypothetical protein